MDENENINLLPSNVKQIGSINEGRKIYIEDYVCTYIQQFAQSALNDEKIAILVGKNIEINNESILFISGVIKGEFSRLEKNMNVLTEKSWDYIHEQRKLFFDGLKIVGWVYIQPGYGDYLNENLINYHINNFGEDFQVLFLFDPMEKVNGFFSYDKIKKQPIMFKGYFIYYERNDGMHEYMLQNKVSKLKNEKNEDAGNSDTQNIKKTVKPKAKVRTAQTKSRNSAEQKKMVNLFGTLSFVLFLVCFIMGAGLIQNDDRISKLEQQIAAIDNSYQYLLTKVKDDNSQNVFAAQNDIPVTTQTITEVITETMTEKLTEKLTESPTKAPKNFQNYTVSQGDTLSSICRKFYGDDTMIKEVLEFNDISDPDKICFGNIIKLPEK